MYNKSTKIMSQVIFKGCIIQKGDRIKIPKPIIDTLKLSSGKKIIVLFNPDKKEIIIKEDISKE
jgi:5S rRNA maturation endonuclease (ribonuclease M5)